jgi:CXXX repeat modification system protein
MADVSCGKVSEVERDEIKLIFRRKLALAEMFLALGKADDTAFDKLYERALADMGETAERFHNWWRTTATRHGWQGAEGASWRIDFDSCEVFLVQP